MKHTTGTWRFNTSRSCLLSLDGTNKHKTIMSCEMGKGPKKCDARLIEAAPEMLEALEMVQRAYAGDAITLPTAVDACLLAIKKARGRR